MHPMIFKRKFPLKALVEENTRLRALRVEADLRSEAKDMAQRAWVNERIDAWNSAMRALNGPRRGETERSYRSRIVAANKAPADE